MSAFRRHRRHARSLTLVLVVLAGTGVVLFLGLMAGARPMDFPGLLSALASPDGSVPSIIVWHLRLPRSLIAFCAGSGLSVSGLLLQSISRNPLAGPGLTGATSGAVAPIVVCLVFFPGLSSGFYAAIGMAGGISASMLTFWIARGGNGGPLHLALGGMTVALFLSAITTAVLLSSGPQAATLTFWLAGGFQGRSWEQLGYMLPWVLAGGIGALVCQRAVGLLAVSENLAACAGLNVAFWKPALLFVAILPVAGVVPVAGPIAFVGLATPHIAKLLKPAGAGWTIALTASLGGLMTTAADIVARSLAAPQELPVGMITAMLGGPVFIYLIQRVGASQGTQS
ncbi:iron ABC transporter permease [Roseibium sp. RKSG952]|nr:iron ABC transporter permease [Roseibium sp. RKSG952]MTH95806.1 iron ABC transporter permease [Roseibium sp. RKSG952]